MTQNHPLALLHAELRSSQPQKEINRVNHVNNLAALGAGSMMEKVPRDSLVASLAQNDSE